MNKKTSLLLISSVVFSAALGAATYGLLFSPNVGSAKAHSEPSFESIASLVEKNEPNRSSDIRTWSSTEKHIIVAKAMMDYVAWAETGWEPGKDYESYRKVFGGASFDSFEKHPDILNCVYTGDGRICSHAAGKYQFMEATYLEVLSRYEYWPVEESGGLFSPRMQDIAFLRLMNEEGSFYFLETGLTVLNGEISVTDEALKLAFNASSNRWCSIPGWDRGECDDPRQAMKSLSASIEVFNEALERHQKEMK